MKALERLTLFLLQMSNEARGINSKPLEQLRTDLFFFSLSPSGASVITLATT